jgi:hypothetical protein
MTRATTAAVVAAADANFQAEPCCAPHSVAKLYYFAWTEHVQEAYEAAFGELRMHVDGVERAPVTWPQWTVSTRIDTSAHWQRVWAAIRCHRSQLPGYEKLLSLPEAYHKTLWGELTFHRVYSLVANSDREDDLFDGIRDGRPAWLAGG